MHPGCRSGLAERRPLAAGVQGAPGCRVAAVVLRREAVQFVEESASSHRHTPCEQMRR
jgi:hypothetical protein